MNKMFSRFIMAAVTGCLILGGCSGVTGMTDISSNENCPSITIGITNENISIPDSSNAKTILPSDWSETDVAALKFYLSGTSAMGSEVAELKETASSKGKLITFTAQKATVSLTYDIWHLKLQAVNANGDTVLVGETTADLRNGSTPALFELESTKDVAGNVSVTVDFKDDDSVAEKIEYGVKEIGSDAPVMDTAGASTVTTVTDLTTLDASAKTGFAKKISFVKDILPGQYIFYMNFIGKDDMTCGFYSEIIQVEAGNTSAKEIEFTNMATKPVAPENFYASIVENSEDTVTGFYNVKFTWDDKADNEENFVITIKDYSENASGDVYAVLGIETDAADSTKKLYTDSSYRVSGSLFASNTEFTVKLPMGKLFDAEIEAQNHWGKSTSVARTDDPADTTIYAADKNINRFYFKYAFSGGTLKFASTASAKDSYTEIYSIGDSLASSVLACDIVSNNASDPVEYPSLEKLNYTFQKFTSNGNDISVADLAGNFKNVSFTAVFKSNYELGIEYVTPVHTDIDSTKVEITFDGDAYEGVNLLSYKALKVNVEAKSGNYKTFYVEVDGNKFEEITINGKTTFAVSGEYFNKTGPCSLTVYVQDASGKLYSANYQFNVKVE